LLPVIGRLRRIRIRFGPIVQESSQAQRAGNHFGLRLADRHAHGLKGKTKGWTRSWQRRHACRRKADRILHLFVRYPTTRVLLNAIFGLWWADPVAGLVMVPIIAKEGIEGLQGKACIDCCAGDN
jgi:hypothetical protein